MINSTPLTPIEDPNELAALQTRLRTVLVSQEDNVTYVGLIKQAGWIAVPDESGAFLVRSQIASLLNAVPRPEASLIALPHYITRPAVPGYKMPATEAGLQAFNHACYPVDYILFVGAPDWLIHCSGAGFLVYAGPSTFVIPAMNVLPDEAFPQFQDFTTAPYWWEDERRQLERVYHVLKDDYPQATPGDIIVCEGVYGSHKVTGTACPVDDDGIIHVSTAEFVL